MTRTNLADTLDAPLVRPTSRHCRLDLRAVPAPAAARTAPRPARRGPGRAALMRLGATIIALELVVAGSLRLGVGDVEPTVASAAAPTAQVAPRETGRSLAAFEAPKAHPAVAVALRDAAERVADADLAPAHLGARPTGFGTF